MKILIADSFLDEGVHAFRKLGFDVEVSPLLTGDALKEKIRDKDPSILIVRSTEVTASMIQQAKSLALIVRAGSGYNTIDVSAASRKGVYLATCPGKNATAVAELTWGLIIALDRHIFDCTKDLRNGQWNKQSYSNAKGLSGRTLGLVGFGKIGELVAHRAHVFDMSVIVWSRSLTLERAKSHNVRLATSPIEIAQVADIVSVHVALHRDTKYMINKEFFDAMKQDAYFINTSRGDIVNGEALQQAITRKGIRAGLDVWNKQPSSSVAEFTDPLGALPQVYGTHHIGASTDQAQLATANEAVRIVQTFKETGEVLHCVNINKHTKESSTILVRHYNVVGALAYVLEKIRNADINILEMSNQLFNDDIAATARLTLNRKPDDTLIEAIQNNENIISVRIMNE